MTRSEQKRGIRGVLVASLFLATGMVGCGSKLDGGNTGSETHWLKSCDRDSECGEYSCLCGVCSRECDQQAECDQSASVDGYCAAASSVSACGDDTPARICLERDDIASSSPDAGEPTFTADAGEQVIQVPLPEPCYVDATAPGLPGVSVHLETDDCSFVVGVGGEFRYTVTLNQSFDFTTESSGNGCGLCGGVTDPQTWTQFVIAGDGLSYCPECDVGCCPAQAVATSVDAQTIEGTIEWPGLEWNGPSDTQAQPEGEFPAGNYSASLTFALPGIGEVVARLPITVATSTLTP